MPDSATDAFIDDCRQARAALVGLIEALENKALAVATPITIPADMDATAQAAIAGMARAVADLGALISAYEAALP